MRIFQNAKELISEMGRELNSYGQIVKPKTYQNKVIEGDEDMVTKEIICQQYCLTHLPDPEYLFIYTHTKEWADEEFRERISGHQLNPGEAWKLNKAMWEEFLVGGLLFDYTYSQRINSKVKFHNQVTTKLKAVINILKEDPDTRKAVLNIFSDEDTSHYHGDARIPCSMYYDFLIRENSKGQKQLNICYHQRSSDFVGHFGDDVYLAWNLMQYIAKQVEVLPGYLYHTIDSLHVYRRDWDALRDNVEDALVVYKRDSSYLLDDLENL
jgi:thymidylate synthase